MAVESLAFVVEVWAFGDCAGGCRSKGCGSEEVCVDLVAVIIGGLDRSGGCIGLCGSGGCIGLCESGGCNSRRSVWIW